MKTNGPFSGRIDSTEYAIANEFGEIISKPFPTKEGARNDLAEWQEWKPHWNFYIVHRRVIREPYYLTTN